MQYTYRTVNEKRVTVYHIYNAKQGFKFPLAVCFDRLMAEKMILALNRLDLQKDIEECDKAMREKFSAELAGLDELTSEAQRLGMGYDYE